MSDDLTQKFWVTVGARYTGPVVGRDSIVELSLCAGLHFRGGQQQLLQPLQGECTDEQLATCGISRREIDGHGIAPERAIGIESMAFITRRARGLEPHVTRPPVLLCADSIAEQHVRWYFSSFAGFDPFSDPTAVVLAASWNDRLREHMRPAEYSNAGAGLIAESQFIVLLRLLSADGWL